VAFAQPPVDPFDPFELFPLSAKHFALRWEAQRAIDEALAEIHGDPVDP
jgi:hypothetical protein